jgi:hypothetical protein
LWGKADCHHEAGIRVCKEISVPDISRTISEKFSGVIGVPGMIGGWNLFDLVSRRTGTSLRIAALF